jgi:methylated-DNA-[protein]-cysteine S-methyltransferase
MIYIGEARGTPLGSVWVATSEGGLAAVKIGGSHSAFVSALAKRYQCDAVFDGSRTAEVTQQISEYLSGCREEFELPIDWSGMTPFQVRVLKNVLAIPRGETRTYGEIARLIGQPGAARAVGRANATNPIPLVIPCHRLVGSDGSLRGFGAPGGIKTKKWLLELERTNRAFAK